MHTFPLSFPCPTLPVSTRAEGMTTGKDFGAASEGRGYPDTPLVCHHACCLGVQHPGFAGGKALDFGEK